MKDIHFWCVLGCQQVLYNWSSILGVKWLNIISKEGLASENYRSLASLDKGYKSASGCTHLAQGNCSFINKTLTNATADQPLLPAHNLSFSPISPRALSCCQVLNIFYYFKWNVNTYFENNKNSQVHTHLEHLENIEKYKEKSKRVSKFWYT